MFSIAGPGNKKGAKSPLFLKLNRDAENLLNSVFQCFTRDERWHVSCSDFDLFASLRVATGTLSAVVHFKSTKNQPVVQHHLLSETQ